MEKQIIEKELQIIFHTLCDGLRQEVRQRQLASLATGSKQDFSITNEREIGVASSLASYLRLVGFGVQLDAYSEKDPKRRLDFGIWLPASRGYVYLELKLVGWGYQYQYYYKPVIDDIEKLMKDDHKQANGIIAIGFSKPKEGRRPLKDGFEESLSQKIPPQYKEIGVKQINLQDMDKHTLYAMIGMWVHNPNQGSQ